MDDSPLQQAQARTPGAVANSPRSEESVIIDAKDSAPILGAEAAPCIQAFGSIEKDLGVNNAEGSEAGFVLVADSLTLKSPADAQSSTAAAFPMNTANDKLPIPKMIIEESIEEIVVKTISCLKGEGSTNTKFVVEEGNKVGAFKGDHLCDDPLLARARLFIEAANTQSTPKVGALTIDIPTTTKNSPRSSSSKENSSPVEAQLSSSSRKKNAEELINIKCSVIKGSSLINTSIDIRHHLKVGSSITIDGLLYQIASSANNWTSSHIALQYDWPGDTNFESILTISSPVDYRKKFSNKKKNSSISVPVVDIHNAVNQLDEFLASRINSSTTSNNNSINKNKILSKILRKSSGNGNISIADLKEILPNKNSIKTEESNDFSHKNTSDAIKDKINNNGEDIIESSRQLALNRVTERIREEREQAKTDNNNKIQNSIVAQIVAERKAAELHIKTIERLSLRKDLERSLKHRLICLEDEQKASEELSYSKLDERILKMDEMRKKTLSRLKAAKVKQTEEEELNEKIMVERLRTLGIQNGRALSVPLICHDNIPSTNHNNKNKNKNKNNIENNKNDNNDNNNNNSNNNNNYSNRLLSITTDIGTLRESISSGKKDSSSHHTEGGTLPPIKSIPKLERMTQKTRAEKVSKLGSNSRIPAPIKTNMSNVSSLGGSGNFSVQYDENNGNYSTGKYDIDRSNFFDTAPSSINKNINNDNYSSNDNEKMKSIHIESKIKNKNKNENEIENENVLNDSLDDKTFGILFYSPNIENRNSDFDNVKEREIILDYKSMFNHSFKKEENDHSRLESNYTYEMTIDDGNNCLNEESQQETESYITDVVDDNTNDDNDDNDNNNEINFDDNKSHVSDLSDEEHSLPAQSFSPNKSNDRNKKKKKPFKALKPLVLKPFISLPPADS